MAGMPVRRLTPISTLTLSLALAACGGGGGGDIATATASTSGTAATVSAGPGATPDSGSAAPAALAAGAVIDADQRTRAANATANSAANACAGVRPFYWEIGSADGALASGSTGRAGNGRAVTADTPMRFASATKWLYAGFVAQRRSGQLQEWDERMLTMRSGYTHFAGCQAGQPVDGCLAWHDNDQYDAEADGHFYYGGAHMQKHASLMGLGSLDAAGLAAAMREALGSEVNIGMAQARPAGGATGTPGSYARFLRKLARGDLALASLLGRAAVCASPQRCPQGEALSGPAPTEERWHYSLGHWVENDPAAGDGAFSSPGAFGFYPWVSADHKLYGMLARDVGTADAGSADESAEGAGMASARCGRLIRRAWVSGVAQR